MDVKICILIKKCHHIIRCSSDVSNAGKVSLTYQGVILAHLHCLHNFPYALLALHVLPIGVSYWLTIIACINLIAFLRRVSCLTYRGLILGSLGLLAILSILLSLSYTRITRLTYRGVILADPNVKAAVTNFVLRTSKAAVSAE